MIDPTPEALVIELEAQKIADAVCDNYGIRKHSLEWAMCKASALQALRTGQLAPVQQPSGDATAAAFEVGQQTYERVGVTPAMREVMELSKSNRAATSQPSGDEADGRVIAEVVAWLNNASIWLNGGECCGQKCSDGVCCAPACIWGDELKLLHSVATALETGEWRNAQSV